MGERSLVKFLMKASLFKLLIKINLLYPSAVKLKAKINAIVKKEIFNILAIVLTGMFLAQFKSLVSLEPFSREA